MSRKTLFCLFVSMLCGPLVAGAQLDSEQPGYFPIEELGLLPEESINLEINLTGAMMKLIALATHDDDPELAGLVEDLDSIRVRGADLDSARVESVRGAMRGVSERLAGAGWQTMVRMRDENEEVYVYFKEKDGDIVGLTVLSLEDGEAMLINLVGLIDPAGLSGLADGLDLPELEHAVAKETP